MINKAPDIQVIEMSREDFSSHKDNAWAALRKETANAVFVVLDLSSITEVNGASLGRLLKFRNYLDSNLVDLFILSASPAFKDAVKRANLCTELPVFKTKDEIVENLSRHDNKVLMISADKESALVVRHILSGFDVAFVYRYAFRKAISHIKTFSPSLLIIDFSFAQENREELRLELSGVNLLVLTRPGQNIRSLAGITKASQICFVKHPFDVINISQIFSKTFSSRRSKKIQVMIADDLNFFRRVVKSNLENEYDFICVENGYEALKTAIDKTPDVILMDVDMPVMDGLQACAKIKNNPATANIPIIMITGHDSIEFQQKAQMAGAVDYVLKPPDFNLIRDKIEKYLSF